MLRLFAGGASCTLPCACGWPRTTPAACRWGASPQAGECEVPAHYSTHTWERRLLIYPLHLILHAGVPGSGEVLCLPRCLVLYILLKIISLIFHFDISPLNHLAYTVKKDHSKIRSLCPLKATDRPCSINQKIGLMLPRLSALSQSGSRHGLGGLRPWEARGVKAFLLPHLLVWVPSDVVSLLWGLCRAELEAPSPEPRLGGEGQGLVGPGGSSLPGAAAAAPSQAFEALPPHWTPQLRLLPQPGAPWVKWEGAAVSALAQVPVWKHDDIWVQAYRVYIFLPTAFSP